MTSAAIELITKHAQFQALYEIFSLTPEDTTYADAVNMLNAQNQEGTCADLPEGWECHGGASGNLTYDEMSPALLSKELESWFNVYRSFGTELIDEFVGNIVIPGTKPYVKVTADAHTFLGFDGYRTENFRDEVAEILDAYGLDDANSEKVYQECMASIQQALLPNVIITANDLYAQLDAEVDWDERRARVEAIDLIEIVKRTVNSEPARSVTQEMPRFSELVAQYDAAKNRMSGPAGGLSL